MVESYEDLSDIIANIDTATTFGWKLKIDQLKWTWGRVAVTRFSHLNLGDEKVTVSRKVVFKILNWIRQ